MKNKTKICLNAAALAGFLATVGLASAQTTTTTTSSTQTVGTISQFGPDGIVVKSSTSTAPLTYSSSKTTTYVDQDGNPVSIETVKSGAPVIVYYTQDGDKMIASKVVVQRTTTSSDASGASTTETKKTTTTTTAP
jgi:hypothetical protein